MHIQILDNKSKAGLQLVEPHLNQIDGFNAEISAQELLEGQRFVNQYDEQQLLAIQKCCISGKMWGVSNKIKERLELLQIKRTLRETTALISSQTRQQKQHQTRIKHINTHLKKHVPGWLQFSRCIALILIILLGIILGIILITDSKQNVANWGIAIIALALVQCILEIINEVCSPEYKELAQEERQQVIIIS